MNKKSLGRWGEQLVEKILLIRNYVIVAKNKRCGRSEFDIIASKNNKIFVFEVKTRKSVIYGLPEEAVTKKKLENYERCYYQLTNEYNNPNINYVIASVKLEGNKVKVKFIKVT